MEKELTVMEDPEDLGLKAVMGSRFRDLREEACCPEEKSLPRQHIGRAALWAGALAVFARWLCTGQMAPSAAIPAMVLCALMGGYRFGRGR